MVGISEPRFFMGIDPGKQGGIVVLAYQHHLGIPGHCVVDYVQMPESELDLWVHLDPWKNRNCVACMEAVSSRPGEGVVSSFTFGQGVGRLKMALTAAQIRYELIRPQVWQKELGVVGRKKGESKAALKERARVRAQALYPSLDLWSIPRSKGKQMSICDALLLADYCVRQYGLKNRA